MFWALILLCMQSFLLYASEKSLSFYQNEQVCSLVNDFLKINNISDGSIDPDVKDSVFKKTTLLFEKSAELNLIGKIIEDNQVLVDLYAKNPSLGYIKKALKMQRYITKLEEIKQFEELIITKLKTCCQMPIEAVKENHFNKQLSTLKQLWHCYWLHIIPNTQLKAPEDEETYFTYDYISKSHMESLHYWLDNEIEKFLELFEFKRDHTLKDIYYALCIIIPRLQNFIKHKEQEHDEENNEPCLESYTYMINNFRTLVLQCDRYTHEGYLDEDTYSIRSKISNYWSTFWKTPTLYTAKAFCKLLDDYISRINDATYKKAINKNPCKDYCVIS